MGAFTGAPAGVWLPLVFWYGLLATLRLAIYLLIAALLLQAVLSWISPYSPIGQPLSQLTRPVLRPIRARAADHRRGVDLSPLIAIVCAQLLLMFL